MIKKILLPFLLLFLCISCDLTELNEESFEDKNLSGQIRGVDFTFVSGLAETYSNSEWIIILSGDSSYPYLTFFIEKSSIPRNYTISTFGSDGLMLTGKINFSDGTFYDRGEIEITEIDTTDNIIKGKIWGNTNEENSYISGNFSVVIQ
ncbi:MAG: hypothetical protein JEY91_13565 [Spirochaetaceae bacterium]|nr:hypothetical protein [Spirochaetaceae bacterium]